MNPRRRTPSLGGCALGLCSAAAQADGAPMLTAGGLIVLVGGPSLLTGIIFGYVGGLLLFSRLGTVIVGFLSLVALTSIIFSDSIVSAPDIWKVLAPCIAIPAASGVWLGHLFASNRQSAGKSRH